MDESVLSNTLTSLENSWSSLDSQLNWCIAAVAIGVVIELFVLVFEFFHERKEHRRGTISSPSKPSLPRYALGFVGAGLVAIGVSKEFQLHAKMGKLEVDMRDTTGRLISTADGKAAIANERAARSEAVAKGYEAQIASANARAKEAQAEVESAEAMAEDARSMANGFEAEIADAKRETARAQLDLAKIQERMADRKLSDEQVSEIVMSVKPFAGQEFELIPYWDVPESLAIANRIAGALIAGGWRYVPPKDATFLVAGISGVQVWTHPTAESRVKQAAESLIGILNRKRIVSVPRTENAKNPPDARLRISVGSKP